MAQWLSRLMICSRPGPAREFAAIRLDNLIKPGGRKRTIGSCSRIMTSRTACKLEYPLAPYLTG